MIKGLYAAASALIANMTRQNVLSHTVANLDTPGFKRTLVTMDEFLQVPVVHPPVTSSAAGRLAYIGGLGLGVETTPETTDFSQGALRHTGQPLDLAFEGPGFFRVQTPLGERYTRDGRFVRDADGQLVTVDGYHVLDDAGQPIEIPDGSLIVLGDGALLVDGNPTGQLGLATFADPAAELTSDLPNTFVAAGAPTGTEIGAIAQGYLETTNASPAGLVTEMSLVARAYEAAQQMVQNQDELLGKAIASLGRY
jgi:flagellar basal body rod protein FlgG